MSMILSQEALLSLIKQSPLDASHLPGAEDVVLEQTWEYPTHLGQGYYREIYLRQGLHLEISDYRQQQPLVVEFCDRVHPVELHFEIGDEAAGRANTAGQYWLYSSGLAPAKQTLYGPHPRSLSLAVHIEPGVLQTWLGPATALSGWGDIIQAPDRPYKNRCCPTPPDLKVILQQILACPYQAPLRRLFLEGKVLELVALALQSVQPQPSTARHRLKADDIERIHQAKAILLRDLAHPPSLIALARQVGLNDCTLKRGFRQVFNTTVFCCLQAQRLEQARLLMLERELSVQQAAQTVGYLSRSHFTAAFRKRFGVSPRELMARDRA